VPARKVADVERDAREGHSRVRRSLRDEPIGDSTLIEDLDGARVQTAGARAGEGLALAQLDDGDVDPRQGQLARQHQPGRASAGDHHRVLGHSHPRHCRSLSMNTTDEHAKVTTRVSASEESAGRVCGSA
jgi:hypothetical protein